MFVVKNNNSIGQYLKELILVKYKSVRQFCIKYLEKSKLDADDEEEIRRITNRFSQIINGKKGIQTYDLPIVTDLLSVSCEDILSCGENKVPLNNRKTNYNIAFSNDEKDWIEYLSREDRIAAYADEFGKTVLDYAIEFKNYKFIKFLINNKQISLVSEKTGYVDHPEFGAESLIKERPFSHKTLNDEFYENKLLRTQILSLAIENNDVDILTKMKARVFVPQENMYYHSDILISEYYDKNYIEQISKSSGKIFDYFIEEYTTKIMNDKEEISWLFPFISELAVACIKEKKDEKAKKVLAAILKHNNNAFNQLHKQFLLYAKQTKDEMYNISFKEAINYAGRDYFIGKEKNFVCLKPFHSELNYLAFNIFNINVKSNDLIIDKKIDEINTVYEKLMNLPKIIKIETNVDSPERSN